MVSRKDIEGYNITYLFNEDIVIDGIRFWGSPFTPTFGMGWAFNKDRSKINRVWESIPEDTDVVITHGPPQGILDISENTMHQIEFCGCSALKKRVMKMPNLKLVCFGHIHNMRQITNQGTVKLATQDTIFSNGSVVKDGRFGVLSSNGNILEI